MALSPSLSTVVERRRLRAELRKARQDTGLTQEHVSAETRACRRPGGGGPGLLRNLYGSAFTAGLHAAVLVAGIVSLLAAAVPLSIRR